MWGDLDDPVAWELGAAGLPEQLMKYLNLPPGRFLRRSEKLFCRLLLDLGQFRVMHQVEASVAEQRRVMAEVVLQT